MTDSFGRSLNYLRISVTDRCNLRCRYCMPEEGIAPLTHEDILCFDELERLVRIFADMGVNRVRLTGGEPLVRRDLPELAAQLKAVPGIDFLGLTTNGVLLAEHAQALCAAGVDAVNISLDTTNSLRYARITRRENWPQAWAGVKAALTQEFQAVKINCVLSPDSHLDDWLGVAAMARNLPVTVRFIEWMPIGSEGMAVQADEVLAAIAERFGALEILGQRTGEGPASYYGVEGFAGTIGVIPAMSGHFCANCNRLRLTAAGELKLCLFYDAGIPLRGLLRSGADDGVIAKAIQEAVLSKPERHQGIVVHGGGYAACGMWQIGG